MSGVEVVKYAASPLIVHHGVGTAAWPPYVPMAGSALELSAASNASGAAEADCHLIAVNDHRHGTAPVAVPQHALELRRILLDVDVLERNLPPLKIVTGGLRVRSGVLAEDVDHA